MWEGLVISHGQEMLGFVYGPTRDAVGLGQCFRPKPPTSPETNGQASVGAGPSRDVSFSGPTFFFLFQHFSGPIPRMNGSHVSNM